MITQSRNVLPAGSGRTSARSHEDDRCSGKPFLICLRKQAWKQLLGFFPLPLWDIKPCARSDEQNW